MLSVIKNDKELSFLGIVRTTKQTLIKKTFWFNFFLPMIRVLFIFTVVEWSSVPTTTFPGMKYIHILRKL